jgi:alkanesulfonate monooxygenase SsuD/methylene tetrahydromethanopterin reductase-like flavin-dependent oxidoreductase (luciferase family)
MFPAFESTYSQPPLTPIAGKYLKLSGRNQAHPSPQRTPVIFQAGTSKTGAAFAAKHAEAIFLNTATVAQATKVIKDARAAAAAYDRDPQSLKFSPCIVPITGRTSEEAKQKYEVAIKNADYIAGLGQFSGYTGIDMSKFPSMSHFRSKQRGRLLLNLSSAHWKLQIRLGPLGHLADSACSSLLGVCILAQLLVCKKLQMCLRNGSKWLIVMG